MSITRIDNIADYQIDNKIDSQIEKPKSISTWDVGIETTVPNQNFNIRLFGVSPNITVDWGDGTIQTFTTVGAKSKTYISPGTYTIKINGNFASDGNIRFGMDRQYENSIIKSTSIIPTIPGLTSFAYCFRYSELTSVPENLFANNPDVTDFTSCFSFCTSLTSVPAALFAKNTAVTSFNACFGACTSLTSVPAALFANNPAVTDFADCFSFCTSLTSVPSTLFANNPAVTNFTNCFRNCTSLASVPAALFANNPAVTIFRSCFQSCSSLTSVPAALFANNPAVTSFNACFSFCTSLTSVPSTLFANNTAVTDFHICFYSVTLTTISYSNLLINMASNAASRQNNVPFDGGASKYNADGQTARNILVSKNWSINDGGFDNNI